MTWARLSLGGLPLVIPALSPGIGKKVIRGSYVGSVVPR